jgi:hypothetical protein
MPAWTPIVILPNLELRSPIEAGFACIVPMADDRVQVVAQPKSNMSTFLSRFQNAFGRRVAPSVILFREDTPKEYYRAEVIAGLRDALAISAISFNRALQLEHGAAQTFVWSNFFSIYPWMVAKDDSGLTAFTPSIGGFDEVDKFHGQSSPELFIQPCDDADFDRPLRSALFEKWEVRFSGKQVAHPDIALFRALNMASAAALVPSGQEITYYDVGRQIALWISAFEILSHPGGDGKANLGTVYDLLKSAPWHAAQSTAEDQECYNGKKPTIKGINACWLYGRLYRERNNFPHGNPVGADNLKLPKGRNLFEFAAPLFRMALAAHLKLTFDLPSPDLKDKDATNHYIGKRLRFYRAQDSIEKALLGAHTVPK